MDKIDRISNLPCNMIEEILKYLPLRDAVSTSILSRGWRYKWVAIPYLVFDENFKEKLLKKYKIESVVYQVLELHKGPIVKFELLNIGLDTCRPALDHWLHFLFKHHIEYLHNLTLSFPESGIYETMPRHLFSFDLLTHLLLSNCKLTPPSEFQVFGRLVQLQLSNVLIEPGELNRFISKCPMLRHLDLIYFCSNTFTELKIGVSNLKVFCFVVSDRFPKICIEHALLLEDVRIIIFENTSLETSQSNFIEFFGQLSCIKRLVLGYGSLQLFVSGDVASKFPSKFMHLMELRLFGIDFSKIDNVSCVIRFIKSFLNLRVLHISSCIRLYDEKPAIEFIKGQQNCKLILCHLENVKIVRFTGSEPEMEFVKLLLSDATALIKLELKLGSCLDEEPRMLKELARFRRASSKAEIIIT